MTSGLFHRRERSDRRDQKQLDDELQNSLCGLRVLGGQSVTAILVRSTNHPSSPEAITCVIPVALTGRVLDGSPVHGLCPFDRIAVNLFLLFTTPTIAGLDALPHGVDRLQQKLRVLG